MPASQSCDIVITGADILALESPTGHLAGHSIAIADGVIVAVDPAPDVESAWAPRRRVDAAGCVVCPGFVDAHVHFGAFLGAARNYSAARTEGMFSGGGRPETVIPAIVGMLAAPIPDALVSAVVATVMASMLRAGFTSVVDAGSPGVLGVATAARSVGIRAAVGPSVADQWHTAAGELVRQADTATVLDAARNVIESIDGMADGRIRAALSGIDPLACSDDLLGGISELASAYDIPTHLHAYVTPEAVRAQDRAEGRTTTARLLDSGILDARCTLMHAGAVTDDDVSEFVRTGVTVNHNPGGNAVLGFGIASGQTVPRLLEAGVPIVLGSDLAPLTVSTPFETMRAALIVQRETAGSDMALTLEQVLTMATNSGVSTGRPSQIGRITVGQLADLTIVSTTRHIILE
ncbi:amidohydrolase family protein [Antrihabitans spumae]|uniref:Amidohydrolase family protein n=1 Tax=Antrihabitans spumae TaxID=3373370 RepID=A0ABW7K771_9NOCA